MMSFEDSKAWQLARALRRDIRKAVLKGGAFRDYEFDRQMYSAALSVMNNLAEGWECPTKGEKARFLSYSIRSCGEVRSMLYAGLDDHIFTKETFEELMEKCGHTIRTIAGLLRSVRGRAS